jgi:putative two-component system protein, hydrogenase maturation factor HypX/HoxX
MRKNTATHGRRPEFLTSIADPRVGASGRSLRILFLVSAHNGLSQCSWLALTELGHEVEVAVVDSGAAMEAAVRDHDPELIVCPFLKTMIPETVWRHHRCLIVHPGPLGDRGPSSLDWAIELGATEWGVTVLEANGEFDAGDPVATRGFRMRQAGKASLYRHEVRHAAIEALLEAVAQIANGRRSNAHRPPSTPATGCARPLMRQSDRAINWQTERADEVIRKIRAAEGHPGVLDTIDGCEFHLFGVHRERTLRGTPGEVVAQRHGAICRATVDGAVWITQLKQRDAPAQPHFKLPAARALERAGIAPRAPEIDVSLDDRAPEDHTYRDIAYAEHAGVGYLRFDFYNGAMSTEHCRRLRDAYAYARMRDTKVIVLLGGDDCFSNGIHLGVIEAADDPGAESWRNLVAIDDLVRDIVETDSHLVITALAGDAAAGGVPLAIAADYVLACERIALNPYYGHMGGLYGSEYWTYLLPRRVGGPTTARLVEPPFDPIGTREAARIGLLDAVLGPGLHAFRDQTRRLAQRVANDGLHPARLEYKRRRRAGDERVKPLEAYRAEELARCHECFFGRDGSYHEARRRFIYKVPAQQRTLRRAA